MFAYLHPFGKRIGLLHVFAVLLGVKYRHTLAEILIVGDDAIELIVVRIPSRHVQAAVDGEVVEVDADDAVRLDVHLRHVISLAPFNNLADDGGTVARVDAVGVDDVNVSVGITGGKTQREIIRPTQRGRVGKDGEVTQTTKVHVTRPIEEILAENVAIQLVVFAKVIHGIIAAVNLGRRRAFGKAFQVGEILQLRGGKIRVILPRRIANVVIVEKVHVPKLAVRIVVNERPEAGVGFQVGILLLREVVRLVDKQPIARDTLCRLGVRVLVEVHPRPVRHAELTRRRQHLDVTVNGRRKVFDGLRVGIRAQTTLFRCHGRDVADSPAKAFRPQHQEFQDAERLARTTTATKDKRRLARLQTVTDICINFRCHILLQVVRGWRRS